MNYIGPFLRINTLTEEIIKNQLLHFSRESIKHIVLFSRCGIPLEGKDFPIENLPNSDISILKSFSPLLCIYKKGNSKLQNKDYDFSLKEDSFHREVDIYPNSFMSLCILHLSDYYKKFKEIDNYKYFLGVLYLVLGEKQLTFYASNLRNSEGVFINKKDVSESILNDFSFEEKKDKVKLPHQGFMMAAYMKYFFSSENKHKDEFSKFSKDILQMFLNYKDDIYTIPYKDLLMLTLSFNVYYSYVKDDEVKSLLLDSCDYLKEWSNDINSLQNGIDSKCLLFLNYYLLYKNTGIISFREESIVLGDKLIEEYDREKGILKKEGDKKDIEYTCDEIVLYNLFSYIYIIYLKEDISKTILYDIYKKTFLDTPLILSWPQAPDLDDSERYRNNSKKIEDLLGEDNFKMPLLKTSEENGYMPCFSKKISFNKRKGIFKIDKKSFYSENNLFLNFLIIYLLN